MATNRRIGNRKASASTRSAERPSGSTETKTVAARTTEAPRSVARPPGRRAGRPVARDRTKAGLLRTLAKGPTHVTRRDVKRVLDQGTGKADELLTHVRGWVVGLAKKAKLFYDMLAAWWRGEFSMPTGTLGAITVALLYFLSPFDIIPDVLPLLGFVDDAAIFAFVSTRIGNDLRRYAKQVGLDDGSGA